MPTKDNAMADAELDSDDVYIPMNPVSDDFKYLHDPNTASDAYRETISSELF